MLLWDKRAVGKTYEATGEAHVAGRMPSGREQTGVESGSEVAKTGCTCLLSEKSAN